MPTLVIATSNPGKLQEMQAYLTDPAIQLVLKPPDLEIAETGSTFLENAALKATQVAKVLKQWTIADDSGLQVDALAGAPGVYSARYADSDRARIERLLQELGDRPDRQAQFVCALVIARPDGTVALQTEGICPGEVLYQPVGTGGFGYDPIFYVPAVGKSFAEMPPEVKHQISHRGIAFAQLLPQMQAIAIE